MTRPTKEQLEQARVLLLNELGSEELAATMGAPVFDAVAILLAATAKPTEEELAEEAGKRSYAHGYSTQALVAAFVAGYKDGARREGARPAPEEDKRRAEVERAIGGRCDVCKQVGDHARACPMVGGLGGGR